MKKICSLFLLTAIAGMISFHAYAHSYTPVGFGMDEFTAFNHFGGFGYSFSGFGYNSFGGFGGGSMAFGNRFGYNSFGGFGHNSFGGFDGLNMGFTPYNAKHAASRKIVPMPATASATTASISYDENGEIRIRPFDDEDLFVED